MEAVDGPHPDLNAAPLAISDKVWANMVFAGAEDIHLESLEIACESEGPTVHDARGAELGQFGDGLPEGVNLGVSRGGGNGEGGGKKGREGLRCCERE